MEMFFVNRKTHTIMDTAMDPSTIHSCTYTGLQTLLTCQINITWTSHPASQRDMQPCEGD